MSEEELKQIIKNEFISNIKNNLNSATIFTYIKSLEEKIDKAIECIKNRNTTKSKKERFMSGETTLEKVLKILGEKE